ncbi:hypothetical protein [Agrococcus casei]|uniref:Uncharacterized protein n=1 Tax=Agrococcus casei LMG 22410 TaxID=1255656 RepID=A0A1R4FGS1_9MICO|nr:hypothetical protein [Agrococcus casei]SJM55069.1 hypothetical protein CZ674_04460 [Agrococcus casei LMG 22410]
MDNNTANAFGTPALHFDYTAQGLATIRAAFQVAGVETHVTRYGFIQAKVGDQVVRVAQDDTTFSVTSYTGNMQLAGEVRLAGSFVDSAVLAGLIQAALA